jgi:hypothetical protein
MMKYTPRKFQESAINHGVAWFMNAAPGSKVLYAGPTGIGKSVIQLEIRERFPNLWITSPRTEIIDGLMDKLGAHGDPLDYRMGTPITIRNRALSGAACPEQLIIDEGHHATMETHQQLDLLTGMCPAAAYTATPYRATPKGTLALRKQYGEPIWILSYQEASDYGYIKLPEFTVLPLVDDDIVEIQGGEFKITSIDSATVDRLGDLANHAKGWHNLLWDVPTVFACPSSAICVRLKEELRARGMPSMIVNAATPRDERIQAFKATVERLVALIHINIVSEGVDLPLRRLVDLAPTLSPNKWVQQLGRITRPTEETPVYVGTNRNLMRHAYALGGVVPIRAVVDAEKLFPPSERMGVRALGMEALGRFKPTNVKLMSGLTLTMYSLSLSDGKGSYLEFVCLAHPCQETAWVTKVSTPDGYGAWRRCEAPSDLKGFSSTPPSELSPKQRGWWQRSAGSFGIDTAQEVTRKNFQILPILCQTDIRV